VNAFLAANALLFLALGIALLRNRDTVRRLRALGMEARRWTAAAWPAPCAGAGVLAAGLVPAAVVAAAAPGRGEGDLGLAVFRAAFVAAWVARDLLFLQSIMLRRGARPLRRGLQSLAVYYVCCGVLLGAFHGGAWEAPAGQAAAMVFVPPMALGLSIEAWGARWALWVAAWLVELTAAAVFAGMQHASLEEFTRVDRQPAPAPAC
jgi:hypothetical protein